MIDEKRRTIIKNPGRSRGGGSRVIPQCSIQGRSRGPTLTFCLPFSLNKWHPTGGGRGVEILVFFPGCRTNWRISPALVAGNVCCWFVKFRATFWFGKNYRKLRLFVENIFVQVRGMNGIMYWCSSSKEKSDLLMTKKGGREAKRSSGIWLLSQSWFTKLSGVGRENSRNFLIGY